MQLVAKDAPAMPDLTEAARIGQVLDAVLRSSAERRWIALD
jgi:hypothetical protein